MEKILENTCRNVKKVYPDVDPEELLEDLETDLCPLYDGTASDGSDDQFDGKGWEMEL